MRREPNTGKPAAERDPSAARRRAPGATASPNQGEPGGGLLRGLGALVELVARLAAEGQELQRSGELGAGKGPKAVYGVSVRFGAGGKPEVQPFGHVRPARPGSTGPDVREPMADVFDEADEVVVVAEMPGVEARDVKFDLSGDLLQLSAVHGDRRYEKELQLPAPVDAASASLAFRNGILEIRFAKTRRGRK